ncbi:alpha/beta fold hydrolase [Enterobacter cloacae]|uniref:alpha/beta fold hydrolase n=1 Tax=Enterobacter cloacae TaxID=550 RepID=UPI002238CF0A|nr:alpha/beta hydrolase [Enterobacter cloacae]
MEDHASARAHRVMAKFDVPTLVLHGSNDQIVPFESTGKLAAEMIKNATLKVYDNAPHGFALTHQDQLNEDLLVFVKSL